MIVKKFEGLSRGLIKVGLDTKYILITGELTINKFYANTESIKNWEPPFEHKAITENEKIEIIKAIEEYSKEGEIPVVFD